MKKILFALAIAAGLQFSADAQTSRMVLVEEFTQASCGPCAVQNPAFNTLLKANLNKVVILKYQTSWPGYDPMNLQNPSEVQTRVSYYSVTGVPYSRLDGSIEPLGPQAYDGAPYNVTQGMIDNQFGVPADFTMTTTHVLSSDLDSATVTVTITNAAASTVTSGAAGSLKLRLAVVEEDINFPAPPGTNGEMEFIGVMRKMYPNANGTVLNDSWAASATQTFTFDIAIPSYIYDYSELAFVAFIQDDSNKEVKQTVFSAPVPLPAGVADVAVTNTTTIPDGYCATQFTPTVDIANASTTVVSDATVEVLINGTSVQSQSIAGPIAAGSSSTVTFNSQSLNVGANTISYSVTSINSGAIDYNMMNNIDEGVTINVVDPNVNAFPLVSDFEGYGLGDFPSDLILEDETGRIYIVNKNVTAPALPLDPGAYGQSLNSLRFDFALMPPSTVASVITEKVTLQGGNKSEVQFDYAYAMRGSITGDKLALYLSYDCGLTWIEIFKAIGGSGLETAPATPSSNRFYPLDASHWKTVSAYIESADGAPEILIKVEGTSALGNALYFDNLTIDGKPIGIEEMHTIETKVYPNPASHKFYVEMDEALDFTLSLTNIIGQVVKVSDFSKTVKAEINTGELAKGVYILKIDSDKGSSAQRITIK